VHRAREVALVPLLALAHVHHRDGVLGQEVLSRGGVDLVDLGLRLLEQLAVRRHNFTKYSNLTRAAQGARATLGTCLRACASG
jgi:hypothetical protein